MLIDSCEGTSCEVPLLYRFLKGCFATPLPEKFCSLLIGFFRGQNIGFFRNIFLFCCPGASPSIYKVLERPKKKYPEKISEKIFWIFKLCLLHRGRSFVRLGSMRFTSSQVPLLIGFFSAVLGSQFWKKWKSCFNNWIPAWCPQPVPSTTSCLAQLPQK